jgi:hypothetical protein
MNRKNIGALIGFALVSGAVSLSCAILFGERTTEQIYPLIVHAPFVLFLALWFKRKVAVCILSVAMAYLCCQISNWIGIVALWLTHEVWVYFTVRIVVTAVAFFLLMFRIPDVTIPLQKKPSRAILVLCMMPLVYYIFDYATSVYTSVLYPGMDVVVEFLGFVLCLAYLLFLFLYLQQYEQSCEMERRHQLMRMQQVQTEKELDAIRRSQQEVSILRHDMRHYLMNLSVLVENGENEKAQAYIHEVVDKADRTAPKRYCKNEIINLILSSHETLICSHGIDFRYSLQIPEKLPFSDVDLTSLLSNGLENAIQAVAELPPEQRYIDLDAHMHGEKLLISIKNPYRETPDFVDGLPVAKKDGHGIGTQSIQYITEKLRGNCQFSVTEDFFILRIIL